MNQYKEDKVRVRDRYRERENGRSSNEGSARTNVGSLQPDTATSSSMATPAIVLSGSQPFSGQPPTILQSRDRQDNCGGSYEENFEGSKDSGDTGSVGDPDSMTAFDGQSVGFGSAQRHGSRGSKSRQVMERREGRERDGRREDLAVHELIDLYIEVDLSLKRLNILTDTEHSLSLFFISSYDNYPQLDTDKRLAKSSG
uniref:Uncharacterized protein n=1 Tax=Salix viminalis TaxID=40686 RepID=A0A6N2LD35_SALVM